MTFLQIFLTKAFLDLQFLFKNFVDDIFHILYVDKRVGFCLSYLKTRLKCWMKISGYKGFYGIKEKQSMIEMNLFLNL